VDLSEWISLVGASQDPTKWVVQSEIAAVAEDGVDAIKHGKEVLPNLQAKAYFERNMDTVQLVQAQARAGKTIAPEVCAYLHGKLVQHTRRIVAQRFLIAEAADAHPVVTMERNKMVKTSPLDIETAPTIMFETRAVDDQQLLRLKSQKRTAMRILKYRDKGDEPAEKVRTVERTPAPVERAPASAVAEPTYKKRERAQPPARMEAKVTSPQTKNRCFYCGGLCAKGRCLAAIDGFPAMWAKRNTSQKPCWNCVKQKKQPHEADHGPFACPLRTS